MKASKRAKRAKRAKRKRGENQIQRDYRKRYQKPPEWKTDGNGERVPLTRRAARQGEEA